MSSLDALKPLIPILAWFGLNINAGLAFAVPLRYRPWTLLAILLPAYASFQTINYLVIIPGLPGIWGYITILGAFHFISVLYIKKWTLRLEKDEDGKPLGTFMWPTTRSWKKIYRITCNPRLLNVPANDIAGIQPDLVLKNGTESALSPLSILKLVLGWFIQVFIIPRLFSEIIMPFHMEDFGPVRQVYFRRLLLPTSLKASNAVTVRETFIRAFFAVNSFWSTVLVLESLNIVFALFWVLVARVSEPGDWPVLFGNALEAYTLGRFWSKFWHRGHVLSYLDFTHLLIDLMPVKLKNDKLITTTVTHFLFFLFSGIVHALVSRKLGDRCSYITDIWFYLTNFAAVLLERVVLTLLRRVGYRKVIAKQEQEKEQDKRIIDNKDIRPSSKEVPLIWRCIGYIWVFGFFFWTVAKFYYPKLHCAIEAQTRQVRMIKALAELMVPTKQAASS